MLNYTTIRDLYKSADEIKSDHLVLAEWNMNKYHVIKKIGLYKDKGAEVIYNASSANIITGDNNIIYNNNQTKKDPASNYFSQLLSVFKPDRPDPGIVHIQKFENLFYTKDIKSIRTSNLSTASARFYPVSENRTYDYFNSAKILGMDGNNRITGVSNLFGRIENVNPFVVYENDPETPEANEVLCNKIVIKVQNHVSVPLSFAVDILVSGSWVEIYQVPFNFSRATNKNAVVSSTDDFATGVLELYLQPNGTWSKTVSRMTDFSQLISSNPTQYKRISGIRFRPDAMMNVFQRDSKKASLELIEISPRLEVDVTSYVEQFSIDSSIGDSTSFGLPVGSVVSGAGNITLSNEEEQFLFASILSSYKMLNEDVKFDFYQKVYVPEDDETYNVPLGVLYSSQWNIGEDYSVSVNLEDGMKFLRELSAPDFMISAYAAMSAIILMILDNVGITGLEFKKSSDIVVNDKEDTVIKNFFCKKEQTLAEVLENIAVATQCSIFYDASGKLNVLTKERLTQNVRKGPSSSTEVQVNPDPSRYVWYNNSWYRYESTDIAPFIMQAPPVPVESPWFYSNYYGFWVSNAHPPPPQSPGTDFWFIMDENYSGQTESSFISDYTANVASLSEEKINPITDGDITYHFYGPRKQPLMSTLADTKRDLYNQLLIDQLPLNSLAFSNYDYGTTIFWQPSDDNLAVLGAANIIKDVYPNRLKDIHDGEEYIAFNEENAIRAMYSRKTSESARQSFIIYMDTNEGLTIPDYSGYVLIDNEYIKYRGKLFYVAGTQGTYGFKIIFSSEEFFELQSALNKGDTISFRGLVVDVKFRNKGKDDDKYKYEVIGDGRGKFNSQVSRHYAVVEESDGIEPEKRFKLMLGETSNYKVPGDLEATTKFNFAEKIRYKSAKKFLGTLPRTSLESYLGFLKISGPTGPKADRDAIESIISASASNEVRKKLNDINDQVDDLVPGDFDDYIYLHGERLIYGQKITLPFAPNVVSTRMRLYSPRKKVYKDQEIMATNSSIAGIGFGINDQGEGYFLEVETAGSGKNKLAEKAFLFNLRFYKVSLEKTEKGKIVYTPKLLLKAPVGGFTVFDSAVQVIKSDNTVTDPVFEMDIEIKQYKDAMKYTIYYGDTKIGDYIEAIGESIGINSRNICMFVRGDSQAIYEYIMAAAKPMQNDKGSYFRGQKEFQKRLEQGIIPVTKSFLFKDDKDDALFYYNDFARLARQVREYDIRFPGPALTSALLDISEVNPQYLVKKYSSTAFGAKLVLANISGGAITIGSTAQLPLYILGIPLEELSTGVVTAKDFYDNEREDKLEQTERDRNISIYGNQTFSLDSQYIQTESQATSLMRWVLRHCSRQRLRLTMEIFENPLIELGDKVKVFDKSRGYYENNKRFGEKTFVVSSISRSVANSGPSMTISLTEVGES